MKKFDISNAVLRKDMIIDMKRPKILLLMLGINLLLAIVLLFMFAGIFIAGLSGIGDIISPRSMIVLFGVMVWMEEIAIVFLTPALTAGSISIEKERQTLEVLLTTRMTPWQIVSGKYLSTVLLTILLVISTIPALSVMFLYGGINLLQMLIILAVLVSTTFYISAFGVFFSSLLKNTVLSVILTYIAVFSVLTLTIVLTTTGMSGFAMLNEGIKNFVSDTYHIQLGDVISGDIFITILYFNPLVTLYDAIGQVFGYMSLLSGGVTRGIQDFEIFIHFTNKNILLRAFPLFSVVAQGLASFLMLRAAAFFLKPVKKKRKKSKKR